MATTPITNPIGAPVATASKQVSFDPSEMRVVEIMKKNTASTTAEAVYLTEVDRKHRKLESSWTKWMTTVLFGGDGFTVAFLAIKIGFLVLTILKKTTELFTKGAGPWVFAISGVVAGLLTGYGGWLDYKAGIQKLEKQDLSAAERREGERLKWCGIAEMLLGVIITVLGLFPLADLLAIKIPSLIWAICQYVNDNGWILATAFVIPTLIYSIDWAPKTWDLLCGKTLVQKLNIDSLLDALEEKNNAKKIQAWRSNFAKVVKQDRVDSLKKQIKDYKTVKDPSLAAQKENSDKEILVENLEHKLNNLLEIDNLNDMINLMNGLESNAQIEAATAAFALYVITKTNDQQLNDQQLIDIKNQAQIVATSFRHWKINSWIKIGIQVLYLAAFGVSLGAIGAPDSTANGLNLGTDIAEADANLAAGKLDGWCPFERNTPVVLDSLIEEEVRSESKILLPLFSLPLLPKKIA